MKLSCCRLRCVPSAALAPLLRRLSTDRSTAGDDDDDDDDDDDVVCLLFAVGVAASSGGEKMLWSGTHEVCALFSRKQPSSRHEITCSGTRDSTATTATTTAKTIKIISRVCTREERSPPSLLHLRRLHDKHAQPVLLHTPERTVSVAVSTSYTHASSSLRSKH